MNKAMTSSVGC